jgi:hypothetical protein
MQVAALGGRLDHARASQRLAGTAPRKECACALTFSTQPLRAGLTSAAPTVLGEACSLFEWFRDKFGRCRSDRSFLALLARWCNVERILLLVMGPPQEKPNDECQRD